MVDSQRTDRTIDVIADAVFAAPGAWVAEASSEPDQLPLELTSAEDLARYAKARLARDGHVFVQVLYPDMAGRAVRRTIRLKPGAVPGHERRYAWEGWGLIGIHLSNRDRRGPASSIAANSQARAAKWAPLYPSYDPPSTWDWNAVARHVRRLRRALGRASI